MTIRETILENGMKKAGMNLVAVNALLTNSFELEHIGLYQGHYTRTNTQENTSEMFRRLNSLSGGCAVNPAINSGNGWNGDCHVDGTVRHNDRMQAGWYDVETSSAPLGSTTFKHMRNELKGMLDVYEQAAGKIIHSAFASCHSHFTLMFMKDSQGRPIVALDVPASRVYRYIAKFLCRYNATLKWLCMTNRNGARGANGNIYDKLENDEVYDWGKMITTGNYRPGEPTKFLEKMDRDSYLRVHGHDGQLHWELRMMDCTASHNQLAAWMCLGRAITLWAIDFARNEHEFGLTLEQVQNTKGLMRQYRQGWKTLPKDEIERQWKEIKGYLMKYLKLADSLDCLEVLDKLIENPVPAYLEKAGIERHYNARDIEKSFGFRNRKKNEELTERYLLAVRSMIVPQATGTIEGVTDLDEFHGLMANYLGITFQQSRGQYQMIKREKVIELEFIGGRIIEI